MTAFEVWSPPWKNASDGKSTPGAPVTVVPWGEEFILLISDPNGRIYATNGAPRGVPDPDRPFWAWASVSDGRSTPGAPVTVVPWNNQLAAFLADPNGGIYVAAGDPGAGFGPWASVSDGRSTPGAPVTVVPWNNQLAAFLADPNGGIYVAAGDPQAGFGPWASVSDGRSTPGAPVTVVPWNNQLAAFLAGPKRHLAWPPATPGRHRPVGQRVGRSGTPGAPVTVVPWNTQLAAFLADPNGGIYVAAGDPQAGFGPWASVSDGRSTPGAPVTVVPWGKRLAIFDVDPSGAIKSGFILTPVGDPQELLGSPHADAPQTILEVLAESQNWVVPVQHPIDPKWASSQGVDGKTLLYPIDQDYEWKPVFQSNGDYEAIGHDPKVPSSLAVAAGWVRNPENSKADFPFSHPFGGSTLFPYGRVDWEFGLLPDDRFRFLLSPANELGSEDGDSSEAPTLGVEWDQALLPASFRENVGDGDRVAIFGRWILDQGHSFPDGAGGENYRTEIHPPLLMATGSVQQDAAGDQFTRVLFMSRPFLPSQLYTDDSSVAYIDGAGDEKPFRAYQLDQLTKAGGNDDANLVVYPKICQKPFLPFDTFTLDVTVRAPAAQALPHHPAVPTPSRLVVTYRFVVRPGCSVRVESTDSETIEVFIDFDGMAYTPPALPQERSRLYTVDDLELLAEGTISKIDAAVDTAPKRKYWVFRPRRNVQQALGRGITTSEYDRVPEIDLLDRGNAISAVVSSPGPILAGQGQTVDESQDYPVYGWLEAKWVPVSSLPVETH